MGVGSRAPSRGWRLHVELELPPPSGIVRPCRAGLFSPSPARADDWPEFMGPTRDQISAERGLTDTLTLAGLRLVWEKAEGQGYRAPSVGDEDHLVCYDLAK